MAVDQSQSNRCSDVKVHKVDNMPISILPAKPLSRLDGFHALPPSEWRWFRPGRVFAVNIYVSHFGNREDDYGIERVRRMILFSAKRGFCLAVPIHIYGGQGLG